MKLILLHGSAQDAIFKKTSQIKKRFDPLAVMEILGSDFNSSSPSLFSEERLTILDNPDIKLVEKAVSQTDPDLTILLRFPKALEKSSPILKTVARSGGEIINFDETSEVSIFPFLDMLGVLNKRAFLELEKNYIEFGGQYLLTMLAYFLRRMVGKQKSSSDFMRRKIKEQKKNFNSKRITDLYKEILDTDFKIKQGLVEEKLGVTLLVQEILQPR